MELKNCQYTVGLIRPKAYITHSTPWWIFCIEVFLRHHSRFVQLHIQNTTRGAKLQVVFDVIIKLGIEKREDKLIWWTILSSDLREARC